MNKKIIGLIVLALVIGVPALGLFSNTYPRSGLRSISSNTMDTTTMMYGQRADMEAAPAQAPMMMQDQAMGRKMMPNSEIMPVPPINSGGFTQGVDRTIVKTANLSLVVTDTRQSVSDITQAVQSRGGAVTSSNIYDSEFGKGQVRAEMTLRVPVDKLDETLSQLRSLADKVVQENVTADDRTEQKVDLEAQLKNLRATETQLLSIMSQAKTVEETLEVQRELSNVRNQIERMQAQLENLLGDAAMSTIHVSLSTKESELPVVEPANRSIWTEIRLAARDALRVYRALFVAGLRLSILAAPLLILLPLGWLGVRKFQKKSK